MKESEILEAVRGDDVPQMQVDALIALVGDMELHGRDRSDPMREIPARIGDRWSLLLLLLLRIGSFRHATLKRLVAATSAEGEISQRMLTLRLRTLERDGLIDRTVTPSIPPRVDYAITGLGLSLLERVESLMDWVRENNPAIRASRDRFDALGED
ncbi:helix-turn-helix domain-containing protein [Sphingomonas sp. AOB5]|uniref:winged helix-turn-helix transcriptional regulator n=1 Tax=Sphingomonas sp. AOB5 TaxID=3034017 RepID=UPI0023F6B90A|nr:helix-turn-helix domain-containing protein [Sphingomonas sp. AOB5]MDF7776085.1 helix-turn-helix domain-containing protein [Sphingomonas sp. AOB5]